MDSQYDGTRFKRSTARKLLLGATFVGMMCGIIVFSQNLYGMDMSNAPLHGPFSMEWHLARLRFCVALSGAGLFVMALGMVVYLRSRDDRTDAN